MGFREKTRRRGRREGLWKIEKRRLSKMKKSSGRFRKGRGRFRKVKGFSKGKQLQKLERGKNKIINLKFTILDTF